MNNDVRLRRGVSLIFRLLLGEALCNQICNYFSAVMEPDSVRRDTEQSGSAHLPAATTAGAAVSGGIYIIGNTIRDH